MKNIKNLKIKTKEGFEVKNLQRFPSMEWGEEGGLEADLYYNGKYIMQVYQAGDGGPANISYIGDFYEKNKNEVNEAALKFLIRMDPTSYGPTAKYEWARTKTADQMDDDDWEMVVVEIERLYDDIKEVKKSFKKGYQTVAMLCCEDQRDYLSMKNPAATEQDVKDWLAKNGHKDKYFNIIMVRADLTAPL